LRNGDFGYSNQVTLTNNLPQALTIVPGSITGGADYDATTRLLNWSGMLPSGGAHEISYQAIPSNTLSDGTPIENHLQIHYQRHNLTFNRATIMWIEAPDLTSSTLTAVPNLPIAADTITYTVTLHNSGLKATNNVSTVVRLPDELALISDTLTANEGTANLAPHRIFWQGDLNPGQTVTVSLVLTRSVMAIDRWLPSTAVIQDGVTNTILQPHFLYLPAYKQYLPTTIQK
jgi:uncharacterized repeat protein (TIGR01451 family)